MSRYSIRASACFLIKSGQIVVPDFIRKSEQVKYKGYFRRVASSIHNTGETFHQ